MNDLIGAKQAGEILGLTRQRVWQLASEGELQVAQWLPMGDRRRPLFSQEYIRQVAAERGTDRKVA